MIFSDDFPWIRFVLLSLGFVVLIWVMGKNLSFMWRVLFVLCAPVGVYLAISGKRIHRQK